MTDSNGAAVVCAGSMGSSIVTARSLGRRGVPVVCVAFDERDPLLETRYCAESHVVPDPHVDYEGYVDALADVAAQTHVETVVPLNEYGIYTLVRRADAFGDSVATPLVDWETLEAVWDRRRLLDRADALGVPTPDTRVLSEWDRWDQPSVIKSRYSLLERDGRATYPSVRFVEQGDRPDQATVVDEMGHEPLVQRCVTDGTEFGFFALFDHGEPVVTFQHRRVRSTHYFGGASSHRVATAIPKLRTLGERVLRDLDWHGPAMVEFRRDDDDGEFKLMEVNPRFWGSLALPVAAGVDFPALYYDLATGAALDVPDGYDRETTATYLRGELQFVLSLLTDDYPAFVEKPTLWRELVAMARSLPGTNFDVLSTDDPRPFVQDYLFSARKLL